jgi:hypothetical protein
MSKTECLFADMTEAASLMVHGSLSEATRRCGDPSCACARDPARRHGPHLYLRYLADGKFHSVYVRPEDHEAVKSAHQAWLQFNAAAEQLAADNRKRLLSALDSRKQAIRARRQNLRGKGQG